MRPTLFYQPRNNQVVLGEVKRGDGQTAVFGKNGEVNADSTKEAVQVIAQLIELAQHRGGNALVTENQAAQQEEQAKVHKQIMLAAFDSNEEFAALGTELANEITIAVNREGFMRRLLGQQNLTDGAIPTARMDRKNVVASTASGPMITQISMIRGDIHYPEEFYVTTAPFIEQKEITRTPGDLLGETYVNALNAIMVQEDRTWKRLADDLVGVANDSLTLTNSFLPINFMEVVTYVSRWGVPPATVIMSSDFWQDIAALEAWATILSVNVQDELLATGRLGSIHGMEIISDFYRHPQHRVLEGGDLYVIGKPDMHGQYTDRAGVDAREKGPEHENIPGRGWFMSEQLSMTIINDRSLAKLSRSGAPAGDNRALRIRGGDAITWTSGSQNFGT